jgi:hypothetical protein
MGRLLFTLVEVVVALVPAAAMVAMQVSGEQGVPALQLQAAQARTAPVAVAPLPAPASAVAVAVAVALTGR